MTKKLIEVSLPLDVINDASAYDKMPGIGAHPKGIHHWWARLPLPAARAILFASLVNDPSSFPDKFPTEEAQEVERERLFEIIRKLCQKKIHTKQAVFQEAYSEITKHCNGDLPTVLDPFAGGGSIPLEGMRLGLPVQASDLNPVAVLINKAQLEILPKLADNQPVNPVSKNARIRIDYILGRGFAEDLRYYGSWINDELKKRIGKYYPKIRVGGKDHNVITWLWARTVKCPNPACGCEMPLVRSFIVSSKKKPNYYSDPIIERGSGGNRIAGFEVLQGTPEVKGTVNRSGATCVCCGETVKLDYVRREGRLNRIGKKMLGVVVDTGKGKAFVSPDVTQEEIAESAHPTWKPETNMPEKALSFRVQAYGMDKHWKLFTNRQLLGLTTLQDIIKTVKSKIISDGGTEEYADGLVLFFNMIVARCADLNNALTRWNNKDEVTRNLFGRQAIPMIWDFSEVNLLEDNIGGWISCLHHTVKGIEGTLSAISKPQKAIQYNASKYSFSEGRYLISSDPPYYDNIGYSDLSDFFYVWLRNGLEDQFPDLLKTVLVPKMEELVASPFRYGSKEAARNHFEAGFRETFSNLRVGLDNRFPLTVYYAFKQDEGDDVDEDEDGSTESNPISLTTGWETLLEGLISGGFQITATWPIKASQKWRMVAKDTNALTSYIVLACRPRPASAQTVTRREYLQILKRELPKSIEVLQHSNLAPVDMAQATIGPGMAIFSRYDKIMEQDGKPMTVKTALSLINKTLDEILAEQEGDFDVETRWAISWFEQNTFNDGAFGDADALGRARNTAVNALVHAGIVKSGGGKVKLLSREELPSIWDPTTDDRVPVWELTQHLIKQLQENGETGAAKLYKKLGSRADVARELAYRLFTICEKKGWAQEAQAYNSLVLSWNQIVAESYNIKDTKGIQQKLDF